MRGKLQDIEGAETWRTTSTSAGLTPLPPRRFQVHSELTTTVTRDEVDRLNNQKEHDHKYPREFEHVHPRLECARLAGLLPDNHPTSTGKKYFGGGHFVVDLTI